VPHHFLWIDFAFAGIQEVYSVNECSWMNALFYPSHPPFPRGMKKRWGCQTNPSCPEVSWMFSGWKECSSWPALTSCEIHHRFIYIYTHLFERQMKNRGRGVSEIWKPELKLKAKSKDTTLSSAIFQGNSVNAHWPQPCEISGTHRLLVNPEFTARKFTGSIFIARLNPYSLSSLMLGSVRT